MRGQHFHMCTRRMFEIWLISGQVIWPKACFVSRLRISYFLHSPRSLWKISCDLDYGGPSVGEHAGSEWDCQDQIVVARF
jgi:hypothetical protein